jgi:hypothetical protein
MKYMDNINIDSKLVDALVESERCWQSAEHMIKVILPVVKDQKLFLRALETLYKGAVLAVSSILKYEYLFKRVSLYKDADKNLEVFFKRCAMHYGLSVEERTSLNKLLVFGKKHKESGFEFSRIGKMVILDDNLSTTEINRQTIDEFIFVLRKLLTGARNIFSKNRKHEGNYTY